MALRINPPEAAGMRAVVAGGQNRVAAAANRVILTDAQKIERAVARFGPKVQMAQPELAWRCVLWGEANDDFESTNQADDRVRLGDAMNDVMEMVEEVLETVYGLMHDRRDIDQNHSLLTDDARDMFCGNMFLFSLAMDFADEFYEMESFGSEANVRNTFRRFGTIVAAYEEAIEFGEVEEDDDFWMGTSSDYIELWHTTGWPEDKLDHEFPYTRWRWKGSGWQGEEHGW